MSPGRLFTVDLPGKDPTPLTTEHTLTHILVVTDRLFCHSRDTVYSPSLGRRVGPRFLLRGTASRYLIYLDTSPG
jgi:hypothetical protein